MLIVIHHPETDVNNDICRDVLSQAVYHAAGFEDSSEFKFLCVIDSPNFSVFQFDCGVFIERRAPVVVTVITKPFLPDNSTTEQTNQFYLANINQRCYELGQLVASLYVECMCGIAEFNTHKFEMYNIGYANLFCVSGPAPDAQIDYLHSIKLAIGMRESKLQRSVNENHLDS